MKYLKVELLDANTTDGELFAFEYPGMVVPEDVERCMTKVSTENYACGYSGGTQVARAHLFNGMVLSKTVDGYDLDKAFEELNNRIFNCLLFAVNCAQKESENSRFLSVEITQTEQPKSCSLVNGSYISDDDVNSFICCVYCERNRDQIDVMAVLKNGMAETTTIHCPSPDQYTYKVKNVIRVINAGIWERLSFVHRCANLNTF